MNKRQQLLIFNPLFNTIEDLMFTESDEFFKFN